MTLLFRFISYIVFRNLLWYPIPSSMVIYTWGSWVTKCITVYVTLIERPLINPVTALHADELTSTTKSVCGLMNHNLETQVQTGMAGTSCSLLYSLFISQFFCLFYEERQSSWSIGGHSRNVASGWRSRNKMGDGDL